VQGELSIPGFLRGFDVSKEGRKSTRPSGGEEISESSGKDRKKGREWSGALSSLINVEEKREG